MNNSKADKSNRFFIFMCLFNIGMVLGDLTTWLFEGFTHPGFIASHKIGSVFAFTCPALLLMSYEGYLFECYPVKETIRKILWRGTAVLCIVQFVCSVISVGNGMFFDIGADNIYRRGDWYLPSQFIPLFIFLLNIILVFVCRKKILKRDIYIFSCGNFLVFIAVLIQILNYGIASINAGVTICVLLIFINIQSRRDLLMEQELVNSKISVMLSQIQPHFLYNSLVVIRHLCRTDPELAEETVLEFARYLRGNLDSLAMQKPIPFERELHHTETYLSIEKKRFGSKLTIRYDIKAKDFMIPVLILQPVAENAVRHGITKKENGGTLEIKTEETENSFDITVADDGVGLESQEVPWESGRQHIGIENVRKRLTVTCGGTLEINSRPGEGTTAVISIPKDWSNGVKEDQYIRQY